MAFTTQTDFLRRLDVFVKVAFWAQVAIGALWAFQEPLPPLQDYPNHVAYVFVMLKLSSSAFLQQFYYLDFFPYPYLLQDAFLSLFMVIGGLDFAAKMFVALTLAAIPAGMYVLIKKVMPDKLYLCYFSLPLIWSKPLFKGNCNFLLGIALGFAVLGLLWEILHSETNRKKLFILTAGVLLVYLTHLIAFYLFLFAVLVFIGYHCFEKREVKKTVLLVAVIPALVLMTLNLIRSPVFHSELNLLNQIFTLDNLRGKIGEINMRLISFSNEETRILIPYGLALLLCILVGLPSIRSNPQPFFICGSLFLLYLVTPRQLQIMIRPHERVLVFLIFMLPLCCLNRKYLVLEKIMVVVFCIISFFQVNDYYTRVADQLTPSMRQARALIGELPAHKKLLAIWAQWPGHGQIGYAYCMSSYYTMDREGYVPSLYTQQYTVVKQFKTPVYSNLPKDLNDSLLAPYDFLLVWGREAGVEGMLRQAGFAPRKELSTMSLYERKGAGALP